MKLQHKGLKMLFERDEARLVPASLARRLRQILSDLHYAQQPRDMDIPSYRLHHLKGDRKGQWSVRASGSWRVTFRFTYGEAIDVDLIDYH